MTTIISIENLSKTYATGFRALKQVNLDIQRGEILALLGPNGAGKTTVIRHLMGFLKPQKGNCLISGMDCWAESARIQKGLGYIPGEINFFQDMTGSGFLNFLRQYRGIDGKDRTGELLERFELDPAVKLKKMSKGMKQKVGIVAALMHDPDVLILDEPTSGLDPLMEVVFRDEIARVRAAGATVLLSSHVLSEVELLCDRVSIIRDGRIVDTGTLADMRHLTRTEVSFAATARVTLETARTVPGAEDVTTTSGRISLTLASDAVPAALPRLGELGVEGLRIAPPSLEELFLRHYNPAPTEASR